MGTVRPVTLAALLTLAFASGSEAANRHVLLLQSLDRGNLTQDFFTGDFRIDLDRLSDDSITFTQFVVNPSGFDVSPENAIVTFLLSAYANRPTPDLVVTVGGPAAAFARKYRQQLFPATPMLFAAVDERFLEGPPLATNEAAVAVVNDFPGMVEDILQVFPETSNVFMVIGSGPLGRFWHRQLERDFQRFEDRVGFTWSDTMSLQEMLKHVSTLPARSAIFYMTFDADLQGGQLAEDRVLAEIHAVANAPLFGPQGAQLGRGVVGGRMMAIDDLGHATAEAALRILKGESPQNIRIPRLKPAPPTFDWRELQRWGVNESRLPPGHIIRYREPGVWERYKWVIVAGSSALIGQALLIGALLVHRARRRRAEQSLQEHVADLRTARSSLSHLSGRLMEAQEQERARLARELHDDLGQKMSFLAMDVAQLRETLADNPTGAQEQARELQDGVISLGRDIQRISHRLHSSKIEVLGLRAAADSFCKELSGRHDLKVEFLHENVPANLPEGVAISLFRVLQESLSNVVKHSGARQCRVVLRGGDGELELQVIDNGRGFDPGRTVSGHGLGLISMQERLNLLHGRVTISSSAGAGTTVRASVPLQAKPDVQSESAPGDREVSATTA